MSDCIDGSQLSLLFKFGRVIVGRVAVAAKKAALEVPSEASGAATSDFLRVSTREDGIRFPSFTKKNGLEIGVQL